MKTLALARMMQFGDSMLPIGAFAFSNALEAATQKHVVHDVDTLRQFVETAVEQAARGDGVGVAWASRAARSALAESVALPKAISTKAPETGKTVRPGGTSMALLRTIDNALFARKLPEEVRSMTVRTGKKLTEMGEAVTASPLVAAWLELIKTGGTPGTYPVALAVLLAAVLSPDEEDSALYGEPFDFTALPGRDKPSDRTVSTDVDPVLQQTLAVHLYGVAMGILNASMRLMRVTHTDVQSILFHVATRFDALCAEAAQTPLEYMSNYAPMTDILSAVHARAHVRLFMS